MQADLSDPLSNIPCPATCALLDDASFDRQVRLYRGSGVAFRLSDKFRFESFTPLIIRPPEALFEPTTPLYFASDIRSLGCIIFELLAHRPLIDDILATPDDITSQQVHLQGIMPAEWWSRWEDRPTYSDKTG